MRQVNRLTRRARLALRRPPSPRWLRPARRAAFVLLALGAFAAAVIVAVRVDLPGRLLQQHVALARFAERQLDLRITEVSTTGRQRTTPRELQRVLASLEGEYILTVDLDAVQKRLRDLPWVRRVAVRRLLPGTVLVELEEFEPAAIWQSAQGLKLLDRRGEIIPVDDLRAFRHLPVVAGPGAPEALDRLFALLATQPEIARRTTGAALVAGRRWNLLLDGRIEVRLPQLEPERALHLLAREQARAGLLERAIERIDLRAPGWIVLRLMQPENQESGRKAA